MVNWSSVKAAYTLSSSDEDAALTLLLKAINDGGPVQNPNVSVLYGNGGWYTDEFDPRLQGANGFVQQDNYYVSVNTLVRTRPETRWRASVVATNVKDASANVYVSISPSFLTRTRMITGSTDGYGYDQLINAPNSPGTFFMGRNSVYWPPAIGPIGVVVLNAKGEIDSDVVYGLGLPAGQHCSYNVEFVER